MPEAPISDASPAEDRALLVEAAKAGGAVALEHFRASVRSWDKSGGQGPVSEADLAVNRAVEAILTTRRPAYGWLSEEDTDNQERLAAERVFVVDPIDGTRAFLEDKPEFAVALAVIAGGRPIAGAVCLPALGETYSAHMGGGATVMREGETYPLSVSQRAEPDGARALANRSQLAEEHWPGGVPALRREYRPSLAWRLCLVASGQFDTVLTFRKAWEWDIASGALIVGEAGGRITDAAGEELCFNRAEPRLPSMVAAPPALHARLMELRQGPRGLASAPA
ncbi:MAG: 3'(2'),5'-bisphosphate nucleotidase CysQ [Pseudomonadota bacterium]